MSCPDCTHPCPVCQPTKLERPRPDKTQYERDEVYVGLTASEAAVLDALADAKRVSLDPTRCLRVGHRSNPYKFGCSCPECVAKGPLPPYPMPDQD